MFGKKALIYKNGQLAFARLFMSRDWVTVSAIKEFSYQKIRTRNLHGGAYREQFFLELKDGIAKKYRFSGIVSYSLNQQQLQTLLEQADLHALLKQ